MDYLENNFWMQGREPSKSSSQMLLGSMPSQFAGGEFLCTTFAPFYIPLMANKGSAHPKTNW